MVSKIRKSKVITMCFFVGSATGDILAQADDWTTGPGGNSTRDCLSSQFAPSENQLLWQGSLPAIVAQQAVIEGNTVVMARITSFTIPTGTTIVAHDLHTGAQLWDIQLPYTPPDDWRSRVSAIRDGQVYATRAGNTNHSPLYALDVNDGSIIWESQDFIDESTTEGLAFTSNGDLIVGNFSSVMRISKNDGTTMWQTSRSCPTTNGCLVSVFANTGYFWQASGQGPIVTAIDLATGAVLYSSNGIGGGIVQQLGLFVGPDGTVYAPRTQNNIITDFLVALEDTGIALNEKWSVPIGYIPFGTMGVGPDGSVYSYQTDNDNDVFTILRIDPITGNIVDTSQPLAFGFPLAPRMAIDATGNVFVTNGSFPSGALYTLNADLTLRWSTNIPNVNIGGPAIGQDGILIVCGVGTDVRAYQTKLPQIPGDLNGDGVVNTTDLLLLFSSWGPCANCKLPEDCPADLDGDCTVSTNDLLLLFANWG